MESRPNAYCLINQKTKRMYIDEENQSYIFSSKEQAQKFVQDLKLVTVTETAASTKDLCSRSYADGATTVAIINDNGKNIRALNERKLNKQYYNNELNGNIAKLTLTAKSKYLREFKNCHFIVPIKIQNDKDMNIEYAVVSTTDISKGKLYLAFSDLTEYGKWAEKVKGWQPLQVDAIGLKRIGGKSGIMLNVFGSQIHLNKDMLAKIDTTEESEEDDDE